MKLPDFDQLLDLSRSDPEALDRLRERMVSQFISSADPDCQSRLRGLQFQIDAQRNLASNPIGACVRLSRMMNDAFGELVRQLNNPCQPAPRNDARVLRFERRVSDEIL